MGRGSQSSFMPHFHLILIKASHYDDDGYVIQWKRSAIPSNSLAVLHGLAMDCAQRNILGEQVKIDVEAFDETNTVIPIQKIIKTIGAGTGGLVGIVGVQSNQFPRATDIGRQFLRAGIPVAIGGFHVSGCFAMLSQYPADIQQAINEGFTLVAGEAEGHLEEILLDAFRKTLKSVYNFMSDFPSLQGGPLPFLPVSVVQKTFRRMSSFDAGRGCPFQCSFCTIINVQGRTSRWRSPEDIERIIRANLQQGVWRFLISDDDFARNRQWEPILDRIIHMREQEGHRISLTIQVDTLCHKIPGFIEKAYRAGCHNIFIGLETLNPVSLTGAKKRQNRIQEYRTMLQAWKKYGCTTVAGYIIGFPQDSVSSVARDIEILKNELPVDLVEFFILTPLPGSDDHLQLVKEGEWMDPDMNLYDLEHPTTHHPRMTAAEWSHTYRQTWKEYYSWEHMEVVMRRAVATGQPVEKLMFFLLCFHGCSLVEGIHPLEGGIFRRKRRLSRRPSFPLESPLIFYPRRMWEVVRSVFRWFNIGWKLNRLRKVIERNPSKLEYSDLAISHTGTEGGEDFDLYRTYDPFLRKGENNL